ncbi:Trm112 family protein [Granulicella aggregans]|uniref:Trm112 family protein n=1 Tax=Granulicella aggregans TaxID=474949 RepID=UPI003D7C16FC
MVSRQGRALQSGFYNNGMTASIGRQESRLRSLDQHLTGLLRCPVCRGSLAVTDLPPHQRITCLQCGRCYPVLDDLPVLIPGRASLNPPATPDPSPTDDTASH